MSSVAFSPDGSRLATGSRDNTARVWDARKGTPLTELKGHTDWVQQVAFSPDGSWIITGSLDKSARVWDARTGAVLLELKGHTDEMSSVAFSPDGSGLATGGDTVRLWDARSGALLLELEGRMGQASSLVFSQDGSRLAACGHTVRVWHVRSGTPLLELKGAHVNGVFEVAFNPDGSRLATGSYDNTARLWDASCGTPLLELKGHINFVHSVAFSPDGSRIVTGSNDYTARVWDAPTGTPLLELKGHTGGVYGVAFSPDGSRLATVSDDNTARVWDSEPNGESDRLSYRFFWTRPRPERHREQLDAAKKVGDAFAATFHLDRLMAYLPEQRRELLVERAKMPVNHLLAARTDRLAHRLYAQRLLADGQPGPALPLLHLSLLGRKCNQPPVEEFLIAEVLLALNRPDEARRYYRAAVDWLDRARRPMHVADIVVLGFSGPWAAVGKLHEPAGDQRYNEFDWESWYECDTFRARVEKRLHP